MRISDWSSDVCSSDLCAARRQRGKIFGMPSDDPPILSNRRIALDPFYYRVQQGLIANRLGKKVDRSGLHRLHRHRDIAVAGEEDDRFDYAGRGQISLQIQDRKSTRLNSSP